MKKNNVARIVIIGLSIVVPGLVAILLFSPYKITADYAWVKDLPATNAFINSITAAFLFMGRYFARQGEIIWHKTFMSMALALGVLFLLSYVTYHATSESVIFGDENRNGTLEPIESLKIGIIRYFYLAVLLSHILLSIMVVPFVLTAFYHGLAGNIEKHLKTVRYTWPIWVYVSMTGVMVYLMARPYYPG